MQIILKQEDKERLASLSAVLDADPSKVLGLSLLVLDRIALPLKDGMSVSVSMDEEGAVSWTLE